MSNASQVIKVGGSLWPVCPVEFNELARCLTRWRSFNSSGTKIWIVGGGSEVDSLRNLSLPDEEAHWSSIDVMHRNAVRLAEHMDWPLVDTMGRLQNFLAPASSLRANDIVFSVRKWLRSDQQRMAPRTWDVTSDSISALLVKDLGLESELLLLKSCEGPTVLDGSDRFSTWVESGFVDPYFPVAARGIARVDATKLYSQSLREFT